MAMGVGFTVGQIIDALRDVRLVLLALLANFVAMPLGALALDKMLRLDEPLGGLLLLGAAAGAPFLPKLTELAKGNLPFAVGIMMLLAIGTVGYLPLVLPLLLPGVIVNLGKIAGCDPIERRLVSSPGKQMTTSHERSSEYRIVKSTSMRLTLLLLWLRRFNNFQIVS